MQERPKHCRRLRTDICVPGRKEGREEKVPTCRAPSTAGQQGYQNNGKLMQEINLSYKEHVDCQRQRPAHWKSELLKYTISVLFHAHFQATPSGGGHLSSH